MKKKVERKNFNMLQVMLVKTLCAKLRERRRSNQIHKFYKCQECLEQQHKEDEEILSKLKAVQEFVWIGRQNELQKWDKWLARITLVLNVVMIVAKTVASILSHSISIISSLVDSGMDVTSGAVIWLCIRAIQKTNQYDYPLGRTRLEPLCTVIVAIFMIMTNVVVILEAVLSIINKTVDLMTMIVMCTGTALKFFLYIFCSRRKTAGAQVLALDQRNDILTNIIAILGAILGNHCWQYADQVGAFLVCIYIIISWIQSAKEAVPLLVGKAASPEIIKRISRIAINHSTRIKNLDTIIVYHVGETFIVELHVVMDKELKLEETHDISESLQTKLERLPFVERAFVHCDYKFDGDEHIGHFSKKYI
uniref:ZT_dimer domain-containing protein n=1 Tax=Syphacia muris TaxID=451379 RepID=A0A0N5B0Y3_9BILA